MRLLATFFALCLTALACGSPQATSATSSATSPTPAPEAAPVEPDGDRDEEAIRAAADADDDGPAEYGRFVRTELRVRSVDKAIRFYSQLFGWSIEPDNDGHSIRNGGVEIGRIVPHSAKDPLPIGWTSWIAVLDLEDLQRDVPANGGKIVREPRDSTQGRSAVLAGPTGGVFGAVEWTARSSSLSDPVDGEFSLAQLWTNDFDRAVSFYVVVGGYTTIEARYGADRYSVLVADGIPRALIRKTPPGRANRWIPFVQVADAAATVKRARSLGATIITPPRDLEGVGRLAVIAAPTGGIIGVVQPPAKPTPRNDDF